MFILQIHRSFVKLTQAALQKPERIIWNGIMDYYKVQRNFFLIYFLIEG